jgi:hypothetical protein
MKLVQLTLPLFLLLSTPRASAADEFESVRCGADVVKAVVGRKMSRTTVSALESAHKDLGLKNLGGDGMPEDPYSLVEWQLCQSVVVFLVDHRSRRGVITDAVVLPDDLKDLPQALPGADCQRQGKLAEQELFVLLDKGPRTARAPARKAWRIDLTSMKFVGVASDGLSCAQE